jgi:hypothetical protein
MLNAAPRIVSRGYIGDKEKYAAQREELLALVRSTPGTVYSEDMLLLLQAGKDVYAEPAIITNLTGAGRWDERPFLDMLARKQFPLILARDLENPDRFTPAAAKVIQENYEKGPQLDGLWLYRPRP